MNRKDQALEHYNLLFQQGKLNFQDFDISTLPEPTQNYVGMWVKFFNRSVKLHLPIFEDTYLFQIIHPIIKFLIHDPIEVSHMWGDKAFGNIDNNLALSLISASASKIPPDDLKDIFDAIDKSA